MKPKINPVFIGCGEIRMGPPYNHAYLDLEGDWVPDLPRDGWQDLFAHSHDGEILALVRWDPDNNKPGFRLVVIDAEKKTVEESERIPGCCDTLEWSTSRFKYHTFGFIKHDNAKKAAG